MCVNSVVCGQMCDNLARVVRFAAGFACVFVLELEKGDAKRNN